MQSKLMLVGSGGREVQKIAFKSNQLSTYLYNVDDSVIASENHVANLIIQYDYVQ